MKRKFSMLDIPGCIVWYDARDALVDSEWNIVYWLNRVAVAGTIVEAVFGPLLRWLS